MIQNTMLTHSKQLEKDILSLKKKLKHFPSGKLLCAKNGNRCKWYQSDGKKQTYIPKKNRDKAEQLAIKKYLSLQLDELEKEKFATDMYLRHCVPELPPSAQLLTAPYYDELLQPFFTPEDMKFKNWMNAPYARCMDYPENLLHKTGGNYKVRSKSEATIDMLLRSFQIPFRYECPLELGDVTYYPDFTILHPITGKTYYWEHFGMMDEPSYNKNVYSKLQLYLAHGIIPGVNLITTFETKSVPLDWEYVKMLIRYHFTA